MPLTNLRSVIFPYCIRQRADGTYEFLNREYQPLGFNKRGSVPEGLPIYSRVKGLTPKRAAKISHEGSEDTKTIYLYNDRCIPTRSAANMRAYLDRLAELAKLNIEPVRK